MAMEFKAANNVVACTLVCFCPNSFCYQYRRFLEEPKAKMNYQIVRITHLVVFLTFILFSLSVTAEEKVYGCIYESGASGGFKISVDDRRVKFRDSPAEGWSEGDPYGCSLYRLLMEVNTMQLHCWNEFRTTFWATLISAKSGEIDSPVVKAKCVRTN